LQIFFLLAFFSNFTLHFLAGVNSLVM